MILQPLHRQVGDKSLKKKEFILPFSTGQLSGCVFTVGGWLGGGTFLLVYQRRLLTMGQLIKLSMFFWIIHALFRLSPSQFNKSAHCQ